MAECNVCFRHCRIEEGSKGFCFGRSCRNGQVVAANYGRLTSIALDPIEKKPLYRFKPGSRILSVGSYGCNLRCPFCQNSDISWDDNVKEYASEDLGYLQDDGFTIYASPRMIADQAADLVPKGNIGVAFTYNEPLIGYEFVRDTAKLVKERGLNTVLVTNGTASREVLDKIGPYIDAMNIDLKAFTDRFYRELIKGDQDMVKAFITEAVKICHVELTTLIIPGENDSEDEIRALSRWVAGLKDVFDRNGENNKESGKNSEKNVSKTGKDIPLHITRFFPRFYMADKEPTPVETVYRLAEVARENLKYVYEGNV